MDNGRIRFTEAPVFFCAKTGHDPFMIFHDRAIAGRGSGLIALLLGGCIPLPPAAVPAPAAPHSWSAIRLVPDANGVILPEERARIESAFVQNTGTRAVLIVIPSYSFRPGELGVVSTDDPAVGQLPNRHQLLRGRRWQASYALTILPPDKSPPRIFRAMRIVSKAPLDKTRADLFADVMQQVSRWRAQSSSNTAPSS
jgi:hypothetical protein